MDLGELKPILAALALPPSALLLLAALGLVLLALRRRRAGAACAVIGIAGLWLLSCQAVAAFLATALLPAVEPVRPEALDRVQAIVVLGGGVQPEAPEYGAPQLTAVTLRRLRYGAFLARRTGKPLAFAGGIGWAAAGTDTLPESVVAGRTALEFGVRLRWADARSRDTVENAQIIKQLLAADGVTRVALVTDSWHMPRAVRAFEAAGLRVVPAPTGFPVAETRPLLTRLPSSEGLTLSRQVLREALGLLVAGLQPSD